VDLRELVDAVRRHVRLVVAAVLLAAVAAGAYILLREETKPADKFRAVANVQIPSRPALIGGDRATQPAVTAPQGMPAKLLRGQDAFARSPEVREKALKDADIPTNDASVVFDAALNEIGDTITLTVTSNDAEATSKLIGTYVIAYTDARRAVSADAIRGAHEGAQAEIVKLQSRRSAVESQLRQRIDPLPPVVTAPVAPDASANTEGGEQQPPPVPVIPPGADSDTALLLFERNALANRIIDVQLAYAEAVVNSNEPSPYAEVLDQSGASLIPGKASSPLVPVGIILLTGLALGLAAAVVLDRRDQTIRGVRVASSTLSAPLLSTIPPPRRKHEYAVLERPGSERGAAFRKLAATCVTTDRLPSAIMVSTPEGDTHDDVAANLAAALASLGLQVALVATAPRQSWYLDQFTVPVAEDGNDFRELLELAHEGRFNGEATRRLAWTDLTPNLVVVPPAPESPLTVPLDGLPPFLDSLERSGIDVTVIAGPSLLEDPDATLIAWQTRSVLWAVQVGVVTRQAASEAAARLDLARVKPFGVVMVGAAEA
jgi:Mrp family chromosome partitioning ATPase